MPLKDYTTKIQPSRTVGEVHALLAKNGARKILTEYNAQGGISALSFTIETRGDEIPCRLPVNVEEVQKALERDACNECYIPPALLTYEHAAKVAWRNILHWVDAQMALLRTGQVQMDQVFLPYIVLKGGATLFEQWRGGHLLEEGKGE